MMTGIGKCIFSYSFLILLETLLVFLCFYSSLIIASVLTYIHVKPFVVLMLSKETVFCSIIRSSILQNYFDVIVLGGKMPGQCRNMVLVVVEQSHFWISVLIICTHSYNYWDVSVPEELYMNSNNNVMPWYVGFLKIFRYWWKHLMLVCIVNQIPCSNGKCINKENILFSLPPHHREHRKKETKLLGVISLINCEVINIGKQQQFMKLGTKSPPLWPVFANCLHIWQINCICEF